MGGESFGTGGEELGVWCVRSKKRLAYVAAELGVRLSTVSKWRTGVGRPCLRNAVALERLTDGQVHVSLWGEDYASMMRSLKAKDAA